MLVLSSDLTQGCWLEHRYVILSEIFPLPPDVITDSKRECPRGPVGNSFTFYSLCYEIESLLPWSLTCPHLRRRGHVPPWWEEWARQVTLQEHRWWESSLWLGWRVLSVAVNPLAVTIEIPPLSKIYLFHPLPPVLFYDGICSKSGILSWESGASEASWMCFRRHISLSYIPLSLRTYN